MKRIVFGIMLSITMFAVGTVNSTDHIRIAVLDLEARGTSKTASAAVSEMLRTEMINLGTFTVIERNKMGVILKEQGFSQTGCTDQDCAVQLGKLLSARKILIGTLTQQGAEFLIAIRVVDVEKGIAELGENEVASSAKLSDLNSAVSRLTAKLSARISGKRFENILNMISIIKLVILAQPVGGFFTIKAIIPTVGGIWKPHPRARGQEDGVVRKLQYQTQQVQILERERSILRQSLKAAVNPTSRQRSLFPIEAVVKVTGFFPQRTNWT